MPDSRTDNIVLYGSAQSGHSYKPRLYLLLAGIEHDYQPIDIFIPHAQRPNAFQKVAAFGEVPVLVHNGQVVVQSNAILLHLMRHFGKFAGSSETHLDEINFSPEPTIRGYTLGITVDPVRISNIKEFGSPEEVAARVVTAEVNRDGVFKVTLAKDPKEDTNAGCYDIEYISDGKRGTKRFVTRIYVQDGFLYVLTVQSKEDEYDKVREEDVLECVKSFKPL